MERNDQPRRVGVVTLGLTLVGFGVTYLLRLIWATIPVTLVWRLWPVVMLTLGIEVLAAGISRRHFVIDRGAVVLLFLTLCFIFGLASAEYVLMCWTAGL